MKKINNKGFTLVELLAVIIILAIVVGISIQAIMNTTDGAKKKAFQTAADIAADWFDRQYSAYMVGDPIMSPVNSTFMSSCFDNNGNLITCTSSDALITAAGLKTSNVSNISVTWNEGRACVTITSKSGGDYPYTAGGSDNTRTSGYCS